MPADEIYVDPSITASVIKVGNECYQRVGPASEPVQVTSDDGEFDSCGDCGCTPCNYPDLYFSSGNCNCCGTFSFNVSGAVGENWSVTGGGGGTCLGFTQGSADCNGTCDNIECPGSSYLSGTFTEDQTTVTITACWCAPSAASATSTVTVTVGGCKCSFNVHITGCPGWCDDFLVGGPYTLNINITNNEFNTYSTTDTPEGCCVYCQATWQGSQVLDCSVGSESYIAISNIQQVVVGPGCSDGGYDECSGISGSYFPFTSLSCATGAYLNNTVPPGCPSPGLNPCQLYFWQAFSPTGTATNIYFAIPVSPTPTGSCTIWQTGSAGEGQPPCPVSCTTWSGTIEISG